MCGIAGGVHSPLNEQLTQFILKKTGHRGPDDCGVFVAQPVVLGNVRLSIQDLSHAGHQPMLSADGNYVLVYNGELYNHKELRKELEAKGFTFRSGSDTETLLNAYIAWGAACLDKLNGIFAFAIYDKTAGKVFLARDPMGVKPLYYYHDGRQFLFCSELKGLMRIEGLDYTLQPEILHNYLSLMWSPGGETPFRHCHKLQPGHTLTVSANNADPIKIDRYYQVPFTGEYEERSRQEWTDLLDKQLGNAVQRQLISDAPVGLFLSGGLDSSLIAAYMRQLNTGNKLKAFTIDTAGSMKLEGFDDDLRYAQLAAKHLDIELEVIPSSLDITSSFDRMIWHLDEPQADPAGLFVEMIAKAAWDNGYKVLLSGIGADEVFSGYRRHQAMYLGKLLSGTPGLVTRGLNTISPLLGNVHARRIRKLLQADGSTVAGRFAGLYQWLPAETTSGLFATDIAENIPSFESYIASLLAEIPQEKNLLNQLLYCDMNGYLPNHNLNYTDKMAMAQHIEVRVPYLDKDILATAATIPPSLKMKGYTTKYVLRQVAARYLPVTILNRPKTGFGAPVRSWIKNEMKQMVEERLLDDSFYQNGYFNREAVQDLVQQNEDGSHDAAYTIFALLTVESWLRQFGA